MRLDVVCATRKREKFQDRIVYCIRMANLHGYLTDREARNAIRKLVKQSHRERREQAAK